jgi:hypothetical protein
MSIIEVGLDYVGAVKQWIDSFPASYMSLATAAAVAAFAPLKKIVTEKIVDPYMEVRWARLRSRWIGEMPAGEVPLGKASSRVVIIHGTPAEVIRNVKGERRIDTQVKIFLKNEPIIFDQDVQEEVKRIQLEEDSREKIHGNSRWNGDFMNITRFDIAQRGIEHEESFINIEVTVSKYFEFLATAAKIDREVKEKNSNISRCDFRNQLIQGFEQSGSWRNQVCSKIVNGLPINFLVQTSDGYLVFAKRGHAVAIAPNEVACAVNENIALADQKDGSPRDPELSVEKLIKRGFLEELGIRLDELNQKDVETTVIAFAVNVLTGGHGLLGYVYLRDLTFSDLNKQFNVFTKDRMETSEIIAVKMTVKDIAQFIVKEKLYNLVGVCAVLVLLSQIHPPSWDKVQSQIRKLQ